jgi:mono/diheme cytochrome c family protein
VRAAFPVKLPRPALAGVLAASIALVAAACGTGGLSTGGDVSHGKVVFNTQYSNGHGQTYACSSCHTLAAAGAQGVIGPNLDNAFSAVRAQGFEQSSMQQIVADQIRIPLQGTTCPSQSSQSTQGTQRCASSTPVTPTGTAVMPANLVSGKDLTDVAAFVARCAGNPNDSACRGAGASITATAGKDIFQQAGCITCHTLKDAGSTGTVGPNLDQKKPPFSLVVTRVTNGKNAMPSFQGKLTAAQIQAVAKYVSSVAGK